MDQEMTFSLSYEQLTRFAERRIRECNLDSQGAIYLCESAKAAYSALFDHGLASKSDQRFASIRSTGNLTFSTAF